MVEMSVFIDQREELFVKSHEIISVGFDYQYVSWQIHTKLNQGIVQINLANIPLKLVTPFLLPVDPVVIVRSAALTITSTLMLTLKLSVIK